MGLCILHAQRIITPSLIRSGKRKGVLTIKNSKEGGENNRAREEKKAGNDSDNLRSCSATHTAVRCRKRNSARSVKNHFGTVGMGMAYPIIIVKQEKPRKKQCGVFV